MARSDRSESAWIRACRPITQAHTAVPVNPPASTTGVEGRDATQESGGPKCLLGIGRPAV